MYPEIESLYQHRYGGVYKVVGISFSTVDKTSWVVYEHCYPFEEQLWHRPFDEFCDGRFRQISFEEYLEIMRSKPADEFQKEIAANKEAAKKN